MKYLTGIVGNSPFGIITLSVDQEVGIINADAVYLLGHGPGKPANFIDIHFTQVFSKSPELLEAYEKIIIQGGELNHSLAGITSGEFIINIQIRRLFNGTLVILEDVTKQHKLESRLRHQASHDSLTELANRQEFEKRLGDYIIKSSVHNMPGAVIFIDLDRFKTVNDTAGHAAGDELLQCISNILHDNVRDRDLVARIGGDEFAILLEDCPLKMATKIAETMRYNLERFVFHYGDYAFNIGLSAGIVAIDGHDDKLSTIINAADNACQIAKNEGRNRVHTVMPGEGEYEEHKRGIGWTLKIKKALVDSSFVLYTQEISAISRSLDRRYFEVLIRLRDADGSIVNPDLFIPTAERYDLMPQIDRWVLETSFASINPEYCYAINLSGQSVTDEGLGDFIVELQQKYKINPGRITLEITETAAIRNIKQCSQLINRLTEMGFKFSLDDFGAGLSSFSYLKNIPVSYLKIDGSFVRDITTDPTSYAIVKAINEVGHAMNLKTIAEYVENEGILHKLQELGVDYAQGYHLHKPEALSPLRGKENIFSLPISPISPVLVAANTDRLPAD
jgi:diguanylate cyclase (GGDEF)-like protein